MARGAGPRRSRRRRRWCGGVSRATPALFAVANTPAKLLAIGEEQLSEMIRTLGLYRTKAKNLIALSRILVEQYGGEVPRDCAALEALPGRPSQLTQSSVGVHYSE